VPAAAHVDVPGAAEDGAGTRVEVGAGSSPVAYGAARTGDLLVGVRVAGAPPERATGQVGALLEAVVAELRETDPGGAAG